MKCFGQPFFEKIKTSRGINTVDFLDSMSQLTFKGISKSKAIFFESKDSRYFIKTMSGTERDLLVKMLPKLTEHMKQYKDSMLCKFYGLMTFKCDKSVLSDSYHVLITGNIFRK